MIAGEQLQLPNKTTIITIRHSSVEGWHIYPSKSRPLAGSNFSTPHLNQSLQKVGNQNVKELHLFDVKIDEDVNDDKNLRTLTQDIASVFHQI